MTRQERLIRKAVSEIARSAGLTVEFINRTKHRAYIIRKGEKQARQIFTPNGRDGELQAVVKDAKRLVDKLCSGG